MFRKGPKQKDKHEQHDKQNGKQKQNSDIWALTKHNGKQNDGSSGRLEQKLRLDWTL